MDAIRTEQQPSAASMNNSTSSFHLGFVQPTRAFHFRDEWQDRYTTMEDLTVFGRSTVNERYKEEMARTLEEVHGSHVHSFKGMVVKLGMDSIDSVDGALRKIHYILRRARKEADGTLNSVWDDEDTNSGSWRDVSEFVPSEEEKKASRILYQMLKKAANGLVHTPINNSPFQCRYSYCQFERAVVDPGCRNFYALQFQDPSSGQQYELERLYSNYYRDVLG